MKKPHLLLMLGACVSLNSHAQSFGDFLKSAATQAVQSVAQDKIQQAVTGAANTVFNGAGSPSQDGAPAAAAEAVPAAATPAGVQDAAQAAPAASAPAPAPAPAVAAAPGCKVVRGAKLSVGARPEGFEPAILWPENGQCTVWRFSDFKFEQAKAAKTAFRQASKIPCNDCEGGYAFDAWGGRSLVKKGNYTEGMTELLVNLKQGEHIGWKGNKYHVTITATGSHPVGETPCKQFHYVLKDGERIVAEYDNMYCQYTRPYAGKPTWNEII